MIALYVLRLCLIIVHLALTRTESDLPALLSQVEGIFSGNKAIPKTVMVTACNFGFINHLHNFKCFADRLGMKFIVFALDAEAHAYIKANTSMVSYQMTSGVVGNVTGESSDFRSKQFNLITAKKKEAVHNILKLGYDVLFTDTDVALLRNPMPYLLWDNIDYVHSLNAVCTQREFWKFKTSKEEGNTGFYFVRSNNQTIKLWELAYEAALKSPKLDDQAVFWNVIRRLSDPVIMPLDKCQHLNNISNVTKSTTKMQTPLITCVLDSCIFSSGMLSRIYVPEYTYEQLMV